MEADRLLFIFIIFNVVCLLAVILVSVFVNDSSFYTDPGCSYLQNKSEYRASPQFLMMMPIHTGKMTTYYPMYTHRTEYHTYLVCLNGTIFDKGWS